MSGLEVANHGYVFYTPEEHFDQLMSHAISAGPGDRLAIATMAFDPHDPHTEQLLPELGAAAQRDADVHLAVDGYAFMFDARYRPTGPLVYSQSLNTTRPIFLDKSSALKDLEDQGVHVGITNVPARRPHIPYAGRSHIKGAVFNDWWDIGGYNLENTSNVDVMVGRTHSPTADFLFDTFEAFAEGKRVRDVLGDQDICLPIDETTDLLIDVGKRNQSLIYGRALGIIDGSEDWLILTCQFFPSGKTARQMAAAMDRGVPAHAFFNPAHNRLGGSVMELMRKRDARQLPEELFDGQLENGDPFMHAKIVSTKNQGLAGSHNLIEAGVMLGTAEIALHSTDPAFARQAGQMALSCANKTRLETPRISHLRGALAMAA